MPLLVTVVGDNTNNGKAAKPQSPIQKKSIARGVSPGIQII